MVETSSTRDAFARRGAPGSGRMGSGSDHFKRAADKPAGDHFSSSRGAAFDPARPKQDAFAKKSGASKPPPQKPVKAEKPVQAKPSSAKRGPIKTESASAASAKAVQPKAAAAVAPAAPEIAPKRALHVVPSEAPVAEKVEARAEPKPQPPAPKAVVDDLMFVPASWSDTQVPEAKRPEVERVEADARPRPAGKTSSLVLVTGGALAAASSVDTLDKPAPVETPPPPPKPEASTPPPAAPEPARKSGGGGDGGSGGYWGGSGSGAAVATRKTGIDQDDIVGIVLGVVIIALLLLWLLRGKEGSEEIAGDDPMVSTQFAATDTGPPETFTPLVDPFGDGVVDLTPKGPIPEAAPPPAGPGASSGTETALLETAPQPPAVAPAPTPTPARPPAPAAAASPPPVAATPPPGVIPGLTSHAWFCTGSAELTEAARAELLTSIAAFRQHAGEPLVVHAFADTRGTSVYNLALSGARARVVADFLRDNGMSVVEVEGKGELPGLADDRNCSNQRRADIFLKAGSEYRPSAACIPPEEKSAAICG